MRLHELFEGVELIDIDTTYSPHGKAYGSSRGQRLPLFNHPTPANLATLTKVKTPEGEPAPIRFSVSTDGTLYMWSSWGVTHFDVIQNAGIDERYGGYVEPGTIYIKRSESVREMAPILRANQQILDLMGGANFRVARYTKDIDDDY